MKKFLQIRSHRGKERKRLSRSSRNRGNIDHNRREKRSFVEKIGTRQTVCIGNGNIDTELFKVADEQLREQGYNRLLPPLVVTV